mgnify:CR=1 FL=1
MNEEKAIARALFRITVDGIKNAEWQGEVQFTDNTAARFESLLGLLHLVQDKSEAKKPEWEQEETR